MKNISDVIEQFLKNIIELSENSEIEIQRSTLAEKFQCVPSQINYVISTRFSIDQGFLVESKRGGGGYIKIRKLEIDSEGAFFDTLYSLIGDEISQANAANILDRLQAEGLLSKNEYELVRALITREVLVLPLPLRDQIRSNILKTTLRIIFSNLKEGENNAL